MPTCPTCGNALNAGREQALAEARKRFGTPVEKLAAGEELYRNRQTGAHTRTGDAA